MLTVYAEIAVLAVAHAASVDTMCVHGNPNVLTFDRGTSKLAQGCAGQHALVEVERWTAPLPPLRAYEPPDGVRPWLVYRFAGPPRIC